MAPCGLPNWYFRGGVRSHVPPGPFQTLGTAYGRPVKIKKIRGKSMAAMVSRCVSFLRSAETDHYCPKRTLCRPGLLIRLNSYCRAMLYPLPQPTGPGVRKSALRLVAQLRALRKPYSARPSSEADLNRVRIRLQRFGYQSAAFANPGLAIWRLEYPTAAAVDWRIQTFVRWPVSTALIWQSGMWAMQMVTAARRIVRRHPLLVRGAGEKLHWPKLKGRIKPTLVECLQAGKCLLLAGKVVNCQLISDVGSKKIVLVVPHLKRMVLARLRLANQ